MRLQWLLKYFNVISPQSDLFAMDYYILCMDRRNDKKLTCVRARISTLRIGCASGHTFSSPSHQEVYRWTLCYVQFYVNVAALLHKTPSPRAQFNPLRSATRVALRRFGREDNQINARMQTEMMHIAPRGV